VTGVGNVICGDALHIPIADNTVQCTVTSPPYYGLRDYGVSGQLGLEQSPEEYVEKMVDVFREVKRVLRDDGTLWLNMGDSYASAWASGRRSVIGNPSRTNRRINISDGLKEKDLIGTPWRLALALQADGWWLRSDIIWHKPNPMPESVRDRPTKSHEYLFLLTKSARYYYDAEAIKEDSVGEWSIESEWRKQRVMASGGALNGGTGNGTGIHSGRNRRTVWTIPTAPYKGAHFATFPPALVEPCILAGSKPGDMILDPFCGSGTAGYVALRHGRRFVGLELNPAYIDLSRTRMSEIDVLMPLVMA
jgi:DNA modification methylase